MKFLSLTKKSKMMLENDTLYYWRGDGHNFDSHCRLRIFRPDADSTLVVVSALLGEETGQSLTNAAPRLATLITKDFNLDSSKTLWIENYPDSNIPFSQVFFNWNNNIASDERWMYLSPQQAYQLAQAAL